MSFFADLVGNAALSGEKVLGDHINHQQALDREDHASQLMMDRARTTEALKLDLQEQQRQAQQKRTSEQMDQAATGAVDVGKSRRAQELLNAGAGDASTITPEQSAVLKQAGRIQGDTPLTGIDDQLTAARKGGLHDAEAQLTAARKETVQSMKDEFTRQHQERQDNNVMDRNAIADKQANNQLTGVLAAIEGRKAVADSKATGKAGGDNITKIMDQTRKRMDSLLKQGDSDTQEYKDLQEYWNSLLEDAKTSRAARRGETSPAPAPGKPADKPEPAKALTAFDQETNSIQATAKREAESLTREKINGMSSAQLDALYKRASPYLSEEQNSAIGARMRSLVKWGETSPAPAPGKPTAAPAPVAQKEFTYDPKTRTFK
jgi:hypothetical protein